MNFPGSIHVLMPPEYNDQFNESWPFFIGVIEERLRQKQKHGDQVKSNLPCTLWLTILTEELGEVCQAILKRNKADIRKELIETMAVALAMLESLETSPLGFEQGEAG